MVFFPVLSTYTVILTKIFELYFYDYIKTISNISITYFIQSSMFMKIKKKVSLRFPLCY